MRDRIKQGNHRQGLLRLFGWLHGTLLISLYFGAVMRFVQGEEALPGACLRGLLFLFPLAAADIAARKLPALWQFLLAALADGALAWLLLGTPYAAVPVLLVCFFRARNRLAEEPVESVLDVPRAPGTLLFLLPFFYSALGGGALLQRLTLLAAALYLLLCAAYRGVSRIDAYILLNRGMAGVPVKRIVRTSGLALAGMLTLAAALLLPALLTSTEYLEITPSGQKASGQLPAEEFLMGGETPGLPPELEALGDTPAFHIPAFVTTLFSVLLTVGAAVIVLYGAYRILRNFRGSFTDHRDVVQYLGAEEEREGLTGRRRKKLSAWDRSPNAAVRRAYRRTVRKAHREPPEPWCSPGEIEEKAGLSIPELHALYEKARYSPEGCTPQESRELKDLTSPRR